MKRDAILNNPAIPGAEFLPLEEIRRIQQQRWMVQREHVANRSKFYRAKFASASLPRSLEALEGFPLTDKAMLRESQRQHPPFGEYIAADPRDICRVHRTSGTTGVAMNLALSAADAALTATVGGRAQTASGLGAGHRVVHCLNYQLWMGGFTDHTALEATGATVIPYGVGGTRGLIQLIQELGVTAISCTPSFPAVLEKTLKQAFPNLKPRDLGLKLGLFGGEAGLDEPSFRQRLEQTWGFKVRNSNYGVTDVLCNFAGQSEFSNDLHLVCLDVLYPELVDPDSGDSKPWREGEHGELVLTHLAKQCQPLVRFRTGDIIQLTKMDTAACGRTAPRFRVTGRADDMVVVRGLNLFPAMIQGVLHKFPELSGEWRITLNHPPPYDFLPLEAELDVPLEQPSPLTTVIEQEFKRILGATARLTLLPPSSLPRTEGKSKRVYRNY